MKLRCVVIDDEPLALLVISRFCERRGDIDLKTFSEPRVGIEQIRLLKPDLVLLDIEERLPVVANIDHSCMVNHCASSSNGRAKHISSGALWLVS